MTLNIKHKFTETLRQSVMAYAFNIFGIVAGTMIAYHLGLFNRVPWAIAVYPQIVSARGVIGGLFCGRLSTALHLGTMQPRFLGNTKSFYLLFQAIILITLESSIAMSLVAGLFGSFFGGMTTAYFFDVLSAIMSTMALALAFISPLTMIVSFFSFKHGLDPDIILYPVESTVSDLLITMTYILVVNLFLLGSAGRHLTVFVGLILLLIAAYLLLKNAREPEFVKTIRESLVTLVLVAFIVNVTGATLSKIAEAVGKRREIYTVYPAMIDTMGDVGSIVGSTATTKLALGTLKSSISSIRDHIAEISGAWAASLIMFSTYSILSLTIQGLFTLPSFFRFTALLFNVNIIAASFIIIISYGVAILTYQKGLDPDNFVIPIESSLADSLTTISLLVALKLIG